MIAAARILATLGIALFCSSAAAGEAAVADRFDALRSLVGHCWRGEIGSGRVDTQCYDLLYDGAFVRSEHEVATAEDRGRRYGGITPFSWDESHERIRFHYFTSTGAVSEGHFAADDDGDIVIPERHVAADGTVTEIETRYSPVVKDSYQVVTRSLSHGEWRVMFEATYRRVDDGPR